MAEGGALGTNKANFVEDDLEDGDIRAEYHEGFLEDRELLEYMEKNINAKEGHPEFYRSIMQDMFSTSNLTSNTIWVENPVTGTFGAFSTGVSASTISDNPNRTNIDDENKRLESAPNTNADSSDYPELGKKAVLIPPNPIKVTTNEAEEIQARKSDEWTLVTMEYRNFAFIRRLGFLVFQGVLAGFSVVTVYIRSTSSGQDEEFLIAYQPVSNEIRRFFFILTVISLAGSIDYFCTVHSAADARYSLIEYLSASVASKWTDFQKVVMSTSLMIIITYTIAYLVTLIMSRFDVMVYMQNDETAENWAQLALEDSTFKSRLDQWKTLDQVRLISVLLGWIGCCVLLWMDISRYSKLWMSLRTMRSTALSWMQRAKALEGGKELDNMSVVELKEVVAALEIGLQRSKGALQLKEGL